MEDEDSITEEEVHNALRAAVMDMAIIPMICGSAFKNKGVQFLLDGVCRYLPSPLDKEAIVGINPDTEKEVARKPSVKEPFAALAFKIATDSFVGTLTFFRVYSGVLKAGDVVWNTAKGKRERVGRILQMHANSREEIDAVCAGDIAAAVGLKEVTTGDTLCDQKAKILLEKMEFPEPVISVAIEPRTQADQDKMGVALGKLAQEDPSFRVSTDSDSGQMIISGMGELHLEIIVDRLRREFKVDANVGAPRVTYRESIRKSIKAEGKFERQTGGKGQYGHVKLLIEPAERGAGYACISEIVGGSLPKEFIQAVDQGIQEQMESGVLAGYPTVDVKVTLVDGSYHEVDSNEMAFRIAGAMGFRSGVLDASPVLLEPIMRVEIVTPEENMGDVIGDLNRRRGIVHGMDDAPTGKVVRAEVPLGERFGYATDLRSATQGRASYSMEFEKYAEAPTSVTDVIVQKAL